MPVVIKSTEMNYKDPDSGEYIGVNVIADRKTSEQLLTIENKGQQVLDDIPSDYSDLQNMIVDEYDQAKIATYTVGTYVRHNDGGHDYIYRCIQDPSNDTSWTTSHWSNTKLQVCTELEKINKNVIYQNLFDKDNIIPFHFYAGDNSTPTLASNASYACYLAEIPDDKVRYIMNYKDMQIDAFDQNKRLISTVYFSANVATRVPLGTRYLTISLLNSHVKDYMLIKGETLPSSYVGFGNSLLNQDKTIHEYHIGVNDPDNNIFYPDGENLTALFKRLENDEHEKIIYVHAGTYNIFNEYGGTTYINSLTGEEDWDDVSVFVPPNTKLIGLGTVTLQFKPTASQIVNDHNARLFSILNIKHEFYAENLILDGMNCRYCIHDETSGVGNKRGAHHIYKNIICTKTQDTYGDSQCYGGGFTSPLNYEFENCRMISWSIPFSIHNGGGGINPYYDKGSCINIKDCYFDASVSSVSLSFRNNTSDQHRDIVYIDHSYIGGQLDNIEVTASGNTSYPNSFDITISRCNEVKTKVDVTPPNIYPFKIIYPDFYKKAISVNDLSWNNGAFLSGDSSTYNANVSFKWSSPIYIDKKCKIHIKAYGYGTIINIVSKTSAVAGYYTEVLRSVDSSYRWYVANITEPGYYIFCVAIASLNDTLIYITDVEESQNTNMLSMFNKLICCGDSLTYGLVYTSANTYRQARVPYNEALTKITGVPSERYASAGYTTKDWWDNFNQHLNYDGVYLIFLGTNGGLTDTISTDCSGDDPTNYNGNTNTGCYGKILRTLQINRRTAILIKPPSGSAVTQGVIEQLGKRYGCPVISLPDLSDSYYHYAPHDTTYQNSIHYNDFGYVHLANCINYAINNMSLRNLFICAPYNPS